MRFSRIAIALAVLALGVVLAVLIARGDDDEKSSTTTQATVPTVPTEPADPFPTEQAFAEPPVIRTEDGPVELIARNGTIRMSGVDVGDAQSYVPADAADGPPPGLLGPTLHVKPGEELDLTLVNELQVIPAIKKFSDDTCGGADKPDDETHEHNPADSPDSGPQYTNFHFHGLHVTPTTRKLPDGATVYGDNVLLNLPKGRSHFEFKVPADHEQGTYWYHAHRHGCTDDQVARGLAGLLVIGDSRTELPERFRDVETRSLALKDVQVEKRGSGYAIPADHGLANPTHRTVNGQLNPELKIRPGETQLWRLANTSAGVWYEVALVDPANGDAQDELFVVAEDGNTLERALVKKAVRLGPGQRADVLVRGPESGSRVLKTLQFNQGHVVFPEDVLASLTVGGKPAKPIDEPGTLKPLAPFPRDRGVDRTFVFDFAPAPSPDPNAFASINGKAFDPDPDSAPIADPQLNTTEKWTFLNNTDEWHPIHIHQDDFKVVSIDGKPVDPNGQQDVVALPPKVGDKQGEAVIEMPFEDFDGKFVIHCHILGHEDGGMMGRIDLAPAAP